MNGELKVRILLVDSFTPYALTLRKRLLRKGLRIDVAFTPEQALLKVDRGLYDLCIISHRLRNWSDVRDRSGIDLLKELRYRDEGLRFIFNSDYPDVESVREVLTPVDDLHVLSYTRSNEGIAPIIETVRNLHKSLSESVRELFRDEEPHALAEVLQSINADLVQYLKKDPSALHQIPPHVFEELVAELLAHYGWQVDVTKQTRDGGYDIFAIRKDISGVSSSWLIECKRYRSDRKVGVEVARALYGVKSDLRVGMSMLATTSSFSADVYAYKSSRYDLELRDFIGIVEWINDYRPHPGGKLYLHNNRLIVPGDPEWKDSAFRLTKKTARRREQK